MAIRSNTPNRMETIVLHTKNSDNGTRQHRSRQVTQTETTTHRFILPHTTPHYEEEFEGETEDEARNREQRNERRRVDFENECKVIERKGALVDRIPWDEADTKVKSLIYLSLGAEARRNYHQKNPHTQIEKCTTHELVHELNITFTIPRNTTFGRFKFFKSMQQ